ncbi:hypothetical protein [Halorientalis salina]|uniref:hypothetical protein n=1 Tax=Halorientalis salina TaxID=2932266 RepID=UPI0010AC58C3|nr:hypothetical protein [Halorientalis salina]
MSTIELFTAGCVLLGTVAIGTVIHELSHAAALRAFGVPYAITWLPGENEGFHNGWPFGALASVSPLPTRRDISPFALRTAAVMPVLMTIPVVLALLGILPDPVASGNVTGTAVVVGWLACALPSPRDFSLVWHAEKAVEETRNDPNGEREKGCPK